MVAIYPVKVNRVLSLLETVTRSHYIGSWSKSFVQPSP